MVVNIFNIYFTKLTYSRKIISVSQTIIFHKNWQRSHKQLQHLVGAIFSNPIVEHRHTGECIWFAYCAWESSIRYDSNNFFTISNRKWAAAVTLICDQMRKIIFVVWKPSENRCYFEYKYEMFWTYIASAFEKERIRANFCICNSKSFLATFFICKRWDKCTLQIIWWTTESEWNYLKMQHCSNRIKEIVNSCLKSKKKN